VPIPMPCGTQFVTSAPCIRASYADLSSIPKLDGESRIVTFANGAVQREPLVDSDDSLRRLVYSAVDSPIGATHYNASVQVFHDGEKESRVEWIIDVLPHKLRDILDGMMDRGAAAMARTLEAGTQP
jgi:hypothetical protein